MKKILQKLTNPDKNNELSLQETGTAGTINTDTKTTVQQSATTLKRSADNPNGGTHKANGDHENDTPETKNQTNLDHKGEKPKETDTTGTINTDTKTECCCSCGCIRYYFICTFFLGTKYLAQLVTVPLILIQMFDTYAVLCFFPNEAYCTPTSEYRIHAIQSILTVSFYCSLALSLLASSVLEWKPWPKKFTNQRLCPCA